MKFVKKLFIGRIYLFGIIIILALLSVYLWIENVRLALTVQDYSFHLATASGFARAGGIVIHDFWESAPAGRSLNYPPLFHAIFANLIFFGVKPYLVLRLMIELTIIGGFSIYAWGIKKLFNIKVAFWAVFLLALSMDFLQMSATVLPSTIILFMAPLLFYSFLEKRWVSYTLLLALMFYMHLFIPYYIVASLVLYVLFFERQYFLKGFYATLVAFILYSPWLIHIASGGWGVIKYFNDKYPADKYKDIFQLNIIISTLAIAMIILLIIKFKNQKALHKYRIAFFLIMGLVFLSTVNFSTDRIMQGHLLASIAVPAAMAIVSFLQNNKLRIVAIVIIVFSFCFTPYIIKNNDGWRIDLDRKSSLYITIIRDNNQSYIDKFQPFFDIINNQSTKGELVGNYIIKFGNSFTSVINQIFVANFFASNSNRPAINYAEPEVYKWVLPDIAQARFLILSVQPNDLTAEYFNQFSDKPTGDLVEKVKNNFSVVSYISVNPINNLYLYRNNSAEVAKEQIPKFHFPLWLVDTLLVITIYLIIKKLAPKNKKKHL